MKSYVLSLANQLSALGEEVVILGLGREQIEWNGCQVLPVARTVWNSAQFLLALRRFARRWRDEPSVIHAQRPDDLVPFHSPGSRVARVVTLHGDQGLQVREKWGWLAGQMYRGVERFSLLRTGAILCVSGDTLSRFAKLYPGLAHRLRLLPGGIDLETFKPRKGPESREHFGIDRGSKVLVFVGRFEREKNPSSLLDAFDVLRVRYPDTRLVMVGDGQLRGEIEARIKKYGDKVRLFGPVPQEELALLLSSADALVVTSRREGLPTVALESLASGTPVVGFPVGVLPDVIQSGRNGFLTGVPAELPRLMEKALYETTWVASNCRESALAFGWDRISRAVLEVYDEIAS